MEVAITLARSDIITWCLQQDRSVLLNNALERKCSAAVQTLLRETDTDVSQVKPVRGVSSELVQGLLISKFGRGRCCLHSESLPSSSHD